MKCKLLYILKVITIITLLGATTPISASPLFIEKIHLILLTFNAGKLKFPLFSR